MSTAIATPPPAPVLAAARALTRQPGRRSRLLEPDAASELRTIVAATLERAAAWHAPRRSAGDPPPDAAELLLLTLRHYQRSASTRAAYARDLLLWLGWLDVIGQDPLEAAPEHVEDYLAHLAERGLAEATRARALSAISAYYRRAIASRAYSGAHPCEQVERPRPAAQRQNQARALSRDQIATLLRFARDHRAPFHELVVALLFFNGLRVSEAAADALLADLDEHNGHQVLKVKSKGEVEKNVRVPLNAPTLAALGRWQLQRARLVVAHVPPGEPAPDHLLISPSTARPVSRQSLYGIVRRLSASAGTGHLSPHGLRATMVTLGLDAGVPLRDMQDSARHADPRTTRRYDRDRGSLNRHATHRLAAVIDDQRS